jgi:outer membrane receptor protein involved in Fe transport
MAAVHAARCVRLSNPVRTQTSARLVAIFCGLALFLAPLQTQAQATGGAAPSQTQITGQVTDQTGAIIPGAEIHDAATGKLLGVTDQIGQLTLTCAAPCRVRIVAKAFQTTEAEWQSTKPIALPIDPKYDGGYQGPGPFPDQLISMPDRPALDATIQPGQVPTPPQTVKIAAPEMVDLHDQHTVTVTAYRTPLGELESPVSTRTLTTQDLQQAAAITLDGQLRLIPGAETFRRSSSLVANPSSQGISLRGLGSTSASRTLVTEDDVPLNDAFAGWIHWEEIPELSIHSVEVVRGGASDLYGSSAIGGVINVIPVHPTSNFAELKSDYGSENTYDSSLLLEDHHGPWGALLTGGLLGTDGFVITTPSQRGLIDIPSNVHAQNGAMILDHTRNQGTGSLRTFLRGSTMNEARNNGTPVQTNGTRLWRFATGADWKPAGMGIFDGSTLTFRAYASAQHYRQTFSTIGTGRNSEVLNRFAKTPDDEMGAVLHWSKPLTPELLLLVGADTHDVRAGDFETTIRAGVQAPVNQNDRQRQTGSYAELLFTRDAWTVSASGRIDWFSNFDGTSWTSAGAVGKPTPLPSFNETVFDPRLGISRKLGQHFSLTGSGFRAYRAPTANELYRSTQVGSLLTLPNNNLRSERATGWETGVAMQQRWGTLRTSYFWTRVNRPITALTTNPNSNPIQLMRENLGRVESRGVSADIEMQPLPWMTVQGGYQYTNATVTQDNLQSNLVGNWIPQVAHNMGSAQLRAYKPRIGTLSLQARASGHQFDDDLNTYLLHSYFKLDAYASHDFGKRIELFTSGENLFDRSIEVGRTPTLTLGTPRVARIGFLFKLNPPTQ